MGNSRRGMVYVHFTLLRPYIGCSLLLLLHRLVCSVMMQSVLEKIVSLLLDTGSDYGIFICLLICFCLMQIAK